ncbi:hypothetical protein Ccrd_003280 [Cynara cardunculus var. scolymus]|uniref:Uncharacterized protein n=1 Tax=Cynara cardunculus var. scolymus TaxID=59895 RepID=A0A103XPQ8_CYNCS|nr:hypothetical protein Ccrd_003280 [Cynara cardunculus var. scolymus]
MTDFKFQIRGSEMTMHITLVFLFEIGKGSCLQQPDIAGTSIHSYSKIFDTTGWDHRNPTDALALNSKSRMGSRQDNPTVRNEVAGDFLSLLKEWENLCKEFCLLGSKHAEDTSIKSEESNQLRPRPVLTATLPLSLGPLVLVQHRQHSNNKDIEAQQQQTH